MKKIIMILGGISILMIVIIYVLYKNDIEEKEVTIDIFKEEEQEEDNIDKKTVSDLKVVVDIKGMVANPGVYEVDRTYRVNDVISLAGGLLDGADTSLINLAKTVTDEMTIIIYSSDEVLEKLKGQICVCDCPIQENDACIEEDNTKDNNEIININTASKEELMTLPGIGEVRAEEIINYRSNNGSFKTIDDIKNVSGIGEELFEEIKANITV